MLLTVPARINRSGWHALRARKTRKMVPRWCSSLNCVKA